MRQRNDVGRRGSGALQLAQRKPEQVAFLADRLEAGGPRDRSRRADGTQRLPEREGIVGLDRRRASGSKTQARQDRLGERQGARQPRDIVTRLGAKHQTQPGRAVRERRGDQLEADLRDLIDRERQHVGRQPIAVPCQRIDQLATVLAVMNEQDRTMFEWVRKFNPYDLYTKNHQKPDVARLRPFYEELINEYFPAKLSW